MKYKLFILFLYLSVAAAAQDVAHVDPQGAKLKQFYMGLHVEQLWIAGQHIDWQTGRPDDPNATHDIKTHCSAFAAAACKQLGIYILRPPEHKQGLLANAQYDWLMSADAQAKGWVRLSGADAYIKAEQYADQGYVVAAVCQNPDEHKPGHAALVMPADMTAAALSESGPRVIMAGTQNYNSVSLREGFKHHLDGWPTGTVVLYYNTHKAF